VKRAMSGLLVRIEGDSLQPLSGAPVPLHVEVARRILASGGVGQTGGPPFAVGVANDGP
jgi:hypothetical protein